MPTQPTYPGVYIEEIPSGVRPITGVATSVTAFVGRTRRGSMEEPIRCDSWADFQRQCGGLLVDSELTYAVSHFYLNGGATAIISRVDDGAVAATTSVPGALGALDLVARDAGDWANALRVTVEHGTANTVTATTDDTTFHLTIDEIDRENFAVTNDYAKSVLVREFYPNVSVTPGHAREAMSLLNTRSALVRVAAMAAARPQEVNEQAFVTGEDGSSVPVAGAYTAAITRLDLADVINLLIIPPLDREGDADLSALTAASTWCTDNRAMLIVEPSTAWGGAQDAANLDGIDALRSPNTAFYYPRIMAADPLQGNTLRPMGPAGAVAGVIATTDAARGVWKAPAGQDARLRGARGFERFLTEADIGILNQRGVNSLRTIEPGGPVVWGARTGRGADTMASEWKYLPVRRLALYIEESLFRGTQWAVFEPNDAPLWAQMRLAVSTFMNVLYRAGAFAGASEREAYTVACDQTTTTQADIDRGILNVVVGFAPLKPAEFVILSFQQLAGQAGA